MTSYSELLRDPRWQRKRLEAMNRADFGCQECGNRVATLNVHHRYYEKGRAPWEYPDDAFVCLCEICHGRAEAELAAIRRLSGMANRAARANVLGFVMAATLDDHRWSRDLASNPCVLAGAAAFFGISLAQIHALAASGPLSSKRIWERAIELELEPEREAQTDILAQFRAEVAP